MYGALRHGGKLLSRKCSREVGGRVRESHTPGLALYTTVAGKCPSSPEDEQEKQGESRDRRKKYGHIKAVSRIGSSSVLSYNDPSGYSALPCASNLTSVVERRSSKETTLHKRPHGRLRRIASRNYTNAGRSVSSLKETTLKVDVLRCCELFWWLEHRTPDRKDWVRCPMPPNTLRVHTEYVLVKSVDQKVLWAESRVQGTEEYFPPIQFHA
ncbi:hypothetical protein TNCV_1959021 [Trichonephila clavipes]|nr:hypothetical protein TNCV_1959021 [Trichonephila clavipes]